MSFLIPVILSRVFMRYSKILSEDSFIDPAASTTTDLYVYKGRVGFLVYAAPQVPRRLAQNDLEGRVDAAFEEMPTPHRAARTAEDRVGVRLGPPIFFEGYVPR